MSAPARVPVFPVESPIERAAHSTVCAIEDVDAAIWQANTVAELAQVEKLIAEMLRRLEISVTVAKTRQAYPQ